MTLLSRSLFPYLPPLKRGIEGDFSKAALPYREVTLSPGGRGLG